MFGGANDRARQFEIHPFPGFATFLSVTRFFSYIFAGNSLPIIKRDFTTKPVPIYTVSRGLYMPRGLTSALAYLLNTFANSP
jgi:hypothetical protein